MSDNPQWNSLAKKSNYDDDEFANFMVKVEEVKKLVEGLHSEDKSIAQNTMKLVDGFLGDDEKSVDEVDEKQLRMKSCKTVINQKAFDEMNNDPNQQPTQSAEAFMKSCEADAKRRTEENRLQKECSDTFKKRAVAAFNNGEFEKALSFYNKAVDEYRKSAHLYTSRALTCLKLGLYRRVVEDCGLVLRNFDEKNLKALLYKAKALRALGEDSEAEQCVRDALDHHPNCQDVISEYMSKPADPAN